MTARRMRTWGSCGGRKEARFVSPVSSPRASLLHIVTFLGLSRFYGGWSFEQEARETWDTLSKRGRPAGFGKADAGPRFCLRVERKPLPWTDYVCSLQTMLTSCDNVPACAEKKAPRKKGLQETIWIAKRPIDDDATSSGSPISFPSHQYVSSTCMQQERERATNNALRRGGSTCVVSLRLQDRPDSISVSVLILSLRVYSVCSVPCAMSWHETHVVKVRIRWRQSASAVAVKNDGERCKKKRA